MFQQVIKQVVELTVSAGTATIVGNLVKESLPENIGKYKKVTTTIAGFAISGMAGAAAAGYASKQVDALFDGILTGRIIAEELKNKKVVVVDVKDEDPDVKITDDTADKTEEN